MIIDCLLILRQFPDEIVLGDRVFNTEGYTNYCATDDTCIVDNVLYLLKYTIMV